ncbi:hypothetical protein DFH07DRAFT_148405 [Mycena maculata]|uniref:Uncharacterized protein n=1 Tax=Mycena maculata TaxID=230809 RepID=A0AAD7NS40_9AGAR|nr:hypothetical protein DFH07DRAFT_148405 [Mycena maculata]
MRTMGFRAEVFHRLSSRALLAVESLSQGAASEFPLLRSVICTSCRFNSDTVSEGAILGPLPWAQLQRYDDYECSWYPNDGRQWTILAQLANVVDLRSSYYGTGEDEDPTVIVAASAVRVLWCRPPNGRLGDRRGAGALRSPASGGPQLET